mgnify:CR=1 FL=1
MGSWRRLGLGLGVAGLGGLAALRYGWFGRTALPEPVEHTTLRAPGEPDLAVAWLRRGRPRLLIVAHGFLKEMRWRPQVAMEREAARRFDVLCFDFPGHGRSGGVADVSYASAATALSRITRHAATLGYEAVGLVGFSMGAAAAVIAAADGAPVDAVACVACPGDPPPAMVGGWHQPVPWRWAARMLGTRLGPLIHLERGPAPRAARLAPRPLLVVHCGLDTLVREEDSRALYAAAVPPKDFIELPRSTHAWPPAASEPVLRWMDAHLGPVGNG